ncbi:uncharacterized protein LOC123300773 [Chrysoperla carnea]|uniref:uncharacterized protein LOC123300773 n=1 Tax=Chrysoperla carnea TaxID=189513 RepID=UPI001D0786FF|nr:uncharacterized protein LOC123300773 [Chrysoperla carnea]
MSCKKLNNSFLCVIFVIFLQCLLINNVSGIRCFQCSSLNDSKCAFLTQDDMDSPYLVECPPFYQDFWNDEKHEMFCRLMVQTVKLNQTMTRVTRGCGWVKHHKPCYRVISEVKKEQICQCFEDGCNASKTSNLQATNITAIFALCALFMSKYFY